MKNVKPGHTHPIVCLDAGHYGKYNRSPADKTYYESEMNWKLHNYLKDELVSFGIEVWLTRKNQKKDMGLTARGKASNGADLFLSIHSNAVGSKVDENIDYPIVYVPINGSADKLGKSLAECIAKVMGTKQKGQSASRKGSGNWDYYSVINGAVKVGTPGLILEHSFHTNTRSTKWLMEDANLKAMAKAEALVLAEYFGMTKAQPETTAGIVGLPTLKRGAKGDCVKALQLLLIGYGYSCGSTGADSSFGPATENAVEAYQEDNHLDADAVVGPKTWAKLLGV